MLAAGVIYGTDGFFLLVGRPALARSSAFGLTDVMGRLHETADRRMPVVGGAALALSAGSALLASTARDKSLASIAAALQFSYVGVYARYAKPVNASLVAGARAGVAVDDAHGLQRRWDRVLGPRFALMGLALICLALDEAGTSRG